MLRLFPGVLRVNGRLVLVGDGIKTAKRGRKMPAVKLLHQQSDSKPQYTMGHSLQVVSVLVQAASSVFAVPLAMRIHEGLGWSNRDKRTLLDKMLLLDTEDMSLVSRLGAGNRLASSGSCQGSTAIAAG